MQEKKSNLIRYLGKKFDDVWFRAMCIVYVLWWPVLAAVAVVALVSIALSMTGCEERPTMTAEACVEVCRDAVDAVTESNLRECQNAIAVVKATVEGRQPATNSRVCYNVTADDCKHDGDLCSKVGTRVCYEDNRSDCAHDADLCPGRK